MNRKLIIINVITESLRKILIKLFKLKFKFDKINKNLLIYKVLFINLFPKLELDN